MSGRCHAGRGEAAIAKGLSIRKETNNIGIEGWSFAPTAPYPSSRSRMPPILSLERSILILQVLFNVLVGAAGLLSWASSGLFGS